MSSMSQANVDWSQVDWGVADLHLHSNKSDGTESPRELALAVAKSGLNTFALSDHDTSDGWAEAAATAVELGLNFVPAMELSSRYGGQSVHLLAYLFDLNSLELASTTEKIRAARSERIALMVEAISADYPITLADVMSEVSAGATVGRPHIADALVRAGIVRERSEAFATILHHSSPYYVTLYAPTPLEGVQQIVAAGGVAIMAHPAARGGVLPEKVLRQLIAAGLAGFELDHRENQSEQLSVLNDLVKEFDLIATGSSDYHGAGKPNRIGENITSPKMLSRIVELATGNTPVLA